MEILFKIYEGLDREGPGSRAMTQRALALCAGLPESPRVLELGCGSGGATLALAGLTGGSLVAVDVHQPFLDTLAGRAAAAGLAHRIATAKADMAALDFEPESFDLIWCEGAAYIMGVDQAMEEWKRFLRPGGFLVFSDAVWLATSVPDEVRAYWAEEYPAMRTPADIVSAGQALGYESVGHFSVDRECWDAFYDDLERHLDKVETLYGDDPDGRAVIDGSRREISLYRAHPGVYGYEFLCFRR
ncbi:MAG: class I SAM-dependent methyltransferase [Pseudodesulfovibrio sp.]|uniref:Methyltransferase type 11 n=1 Tax=Pseudodesulfovibrio aespoeensis (strain ATCC 700646 / DSM 10631 / Aspo-2) TaxID=643562 RepID=E6W009_PSEA9|nr:MULTISPECIES: class I SAM-dependent methyltransferase [Pseudodesulfovibrio]MBU4192234.1 class I SAM-dependent methyltransferase [Pseudomonadota bacterium]ADU64091.1 Methyltransferase type 11 [Pseudodesulfovibrio aespoeensis Aspo-2]MBU4243957.1 class I SAM-dependent methyltransferase [Pseudomonadota bacterium]MBU4380216.1 class I SAM-dependent methyltransferase [Pseudomonadota bacterium]MBU4474517.1 class I SAM-dependent methyltransferase [Pseudomonadota bacterium]